jgi:hypothetical protein
LTATFQPSAKINDLARDLRRDLRNFCEGRATFVAYCEGRAQNPSKTAKVAKVAAKNS